MACGKCQQSREDREAAKAARREQSAERRAQKLAERAAPGPKKPGS